MASELRSHAVYSNDGEQIGDVVSGHVIDTADGTLLRILRVEADGTQRCVAAFNRQLIAGISQLPVEE